MKMLMHKVTYMDKGSKTIQTALFTCNMEAIRFKNDLEQTGECEFVSLNKWTWEVEIED